MGLKLSNLSQQAYVTKTNSNVCFGYVQVFTVF